MTKAKVVALTKPIVDGVETAEEFVAYAARVSNPSNQMNTETAPKLLKYLLTNKHWSPFEMVHIVIEVETTRAIAHQIVRHRSFAFQEFCVSEGTLITTLTKSGKSEKVPIKDLYKRFNSTQYWNMSDNLVRVYDHNTKLLIPAKIKEVFNTGIKEIFELTLDNGKTIKATKDHKFLTINGYETLENLNTDSFVATNGIPVYRDYEWLKQAKATAIANKTGVKGIAEAAGIGYDTIRKWLRIHGLQFTKMEVASYTEVWNKGLEKELQPMYGKAHSAETRQKMSDSARKGEESNLYSSGNYCSDSTLSWRSRVAQVCKGAHTTLLVNQNHKCNQCGCNITKDTSEVDHILAVYSHPTEAFNEDTLQVLCTDCHAVKTADETLASKYTIRYSKVLSIKYVGTANTYDMEIDHVDHNYIANGIVTHNSQRYADPAAMGEMYVPSEARLQDTKNRQNSLDTDNLDLQIWWAATQAEHMDWAQKVYVEAIDKGLAKEVARNVLPEGLTKSRLYMAGSLRSWIHYLQARGPGSGTQKEHMQVAELALEALKEHFPSIIELV